MSFTDKLSIYLYKIVHYLTEFSICYHHLSYKLPYNSLLSNSQFQIFSIINPLIQLFFRQLIKII